MSDGEVHKMIDVKDAVFKMKGLTESDKLILIPNGTQPLFENRIGWTRTYLKKAGLVDGLTLAKLMIDYDLGVSTISVYPIKKLDTDFIEGML